MTRPNIAITPSYSKGYIKMRPTYLNAVWAAGGRPSYVAYTTDPQRLDEYVRDFDAFIFAGGVDVDPKHYGEEVKFDSVEILPERDEFELALFERALKSGKPILGICRGVQLINVAMGGSLHQHIDGHSQEKSGRIATHKVKICGNSLLSKFADGAESIGVNSFHHQAIKDIAPGLEVIAMSETGIIEGAWCPEHKFLFGVQWHPEVMVDDPVAQNIFRGFIASI